MNYEEFKQQVVEHIKEHLPEEYANAEVSIRQVTKNNDTIQDSLQINNGDERVSPSINLNESFKSYERTKDFDSELETLANIRMNAAPQLDVDINSIMNFEAMKDRIDCRLINLENNSGYLSDKPYKQIEDLALVYCVDLGRNSDGIMNTVVTDSLLESWQISADELDRVALENLSHNESMEFCSMRDMLKNMMFPDTPDNDPSLNLMLPPAEGPQMYVLTSDDKLYGAKFLADTGRMDSIAEKLGGDFMVIPSSINECILMPNDGSIDRKELENMIHQVNAEQVPEKEILSEHAYAYDSQAHELMRADRYEERQASKQMMQAVDKALNAAVGEENASYGAKAEKSENHRERISVKDKISEKKDIISKKAAEKSAPSKDHQIGL